MDNSWILQTTLYQPSRNTLWGIVTPSKNNIRGNIPHWPWRGESLLFCWCWWATPGKGISVQKHIFAKRYVKGIERKKLENGYEPITQQKLFEMWPDFNEKLSQRMIFEVLSNHD